VLYGSIITAALIVATGDPLVSLPTLKAAVAAAKPGDRITLAHGIYDGTLWLERLRGTEGSPVIIAGADPANPPVIRGTTECIHIVAPAHIVIENFILERARGNGINIDDGGDLKNPAPGVTLRNLRVRDIGPEGNCDGIKLSGLTGFRVENCTIERWGSGGSGIDMVGCRDGLVLNCTLTHTDTGGSNGIQLKGGTRDVTVRSCRFEHAGRRALNIGGSTGLQFFRPAPQGFEARDITVEGCTIVGSEAAVAFVGVDGADVRFNTIYHPARWAIRILQETRAEGFVPCRAGRFTDNLIVVDRAAALAPNIGDATDAPSFVFARNVWYCDTAPAASRPKLPSEESGGTYGQDPRLRAPALGDLAPADDGPSAKAGADRLPPARNPTPPGK